MTRIIAGFAGSLTLAVPRFGTRPTSDRVREAIFSALDAQDALRDARVLDLYAGSGALGLEAASRGARAVTLVEKSHGATQLCRKNAEAVLRAAPTRKSVSIRVTGQPVQAFLAGSPSRFDVIFLDPPYDLGEVELARNLTALAPILAEDATVVVERDSRSPEPTWGDALQLTRRKDYGDTAVWYATAAALPPYSSSH
ncbi:16S rRNA (guanine(966)-N(2))-methyltransferase RsmD [Glaciibacter superstes]|uniref:16S rRNA (guanine(966)-N(2))-methyltransferase RsmD n=1 Tax=Glaciibacter superstes TaxID=501023 RepID=UPI0003B64BEB|nr:16S rRNA (guanine(966)-N(2))-methyltransferase RsmD [Glaciibacter superstes]